MYVEFGVENNDKDPKFEVDKHVRISKCNNVFARLHIKLVCGSFYD